MAFKRIRAQGEAPEDPEVLFRDLKGRKVEGPLSQQTDVIRDYLKNALDAPDVALQLPTGSGKTLVGLLIAEWRRQCRRERSVFLCPTNQLVHQVVNQANYKFGLQVAGFTGRKSEYSLGDKSAWRNSEVVAVTSYSALFNTNPFFDEPHLIVLDDAHTSEGYIASPWSIEIRRADSRHRSLYDALASVLKQVLPRIDYQRLTGEWRNLVKAYEVDKLPTPAFSKIAAELQAVLDAHVEDLDLAYAWQFLRDHLHACHLYFGPREMLLRPLIPPTWTHAPFAGATQRIYMSATLGESGDLERITGRRRIKRLEVPAAYERHGVGRRLFFFPDVSLESAEAESVVADLTRTAGRALYIFPDEKSAAVAREWVKDLLGFAPYGARDIEGSKDVFTSDPRAVAVVANRYDGIDLLGDECRLLVIDNMPQARNAQERFMEARMGAAALLTERVSNRIVQAFGRCTRSDLDFACVVVRGDQLVGRLLQNDKRQVFHPELQAELEFGIEQSSGLESKDFVENFELFLQQGAEWAEANKEILDLRARAVQVVAAGAEDLQKSVRFEVQYQEHLWRGDFEGAMDAAREVLGCLQDPALRGYRALWLYLAGAAASHAAESGSSELEDVATDFYRRAFAAASEVQWLRQATHRVGGESERDSVGDPFVPQLVERMELVLEELGITHNRRYAEEEREILRGLFEGDSRAFEEAQVRLGRLLGYEAGNREDDGAPDPWWLVDDSLCFIFEDYSDADPDSAVSVKKARQVATHPNWARANLPLHEDAVVIPVLVTPVTTAKAGAVPHLGEVGLWSLDEFRAWAKEALSVVRGLRKTFPGAGDMIWRSEATARLQGSPLSPSTLVARFRAETASTLKAVP